MKSRKTLLVALASACALAPALALPGAAQAADTWQCAATAMRGTALGTSVTPVTAGGDGECRSLTETLGQGALPSPLVAATGVAQTVTSGTGSDRSVLALGGVGDLRVLSTSGLPVDIPTPTIPTEMAAVEVSLTALPDPLSVLPDSVTVDLRPGLDALVPDRVLPDLDLLKIADLRAYAGAHCVSGRAVPFASQQIGAASFLGQDISLDEALDRTGNLLASGEIDPSDIDLALIELPAPLSIDDPLHGSALRTILRSKLDELAALLLPGLDAAVSITPGRQSSTEDSIYQSGPRVKVSIGSVTIADLTVGEAAAAARAADCNPAALPATKSEALLSCTKRRLVLEDVQQRGRRVRLLGVADKSLAGKLVRLRLTTTGRTVARTRIRPDGRFSATAALPPKRWIGTNKARYQAVAGRERSRSLKLTRRMILSGMGKRGGKVVIAGRVTRPFTRPMSRVVVKQRVSCKRDKVVARIRPQRNGRFRIKLDAPAKSGAAVYRLETEVREQVSNPRTYPTFTLPRAVELD